MEKVKLLEDYDHNTIINKLLNNNAFIMQEDYEHKWLPYFKLTIIETLIEIENITDKASNINDLYKLFDTKGFSNTQRLLYKKVFRPNAYMNAVLQTLADLGCCAAKKIRQLYYDEIKKWDNARMYDAFNDLFDAGFISKELLLYTGPTKVKIWKAPFYTQDQYTKAIEIYEAQRISYEERQKKKELIITHNYNKAPEKKPYKKPVEPVEKSKPFSDDVIATIRAREKSKGGIK